MKGWEKNAVQYVKDKTIGSCPNCGSDKVKVEDCVRGNRRSLSFECEECKSWMHFDGFANEAG